jgi:hypothetical protein
VVEAPAGLESLAGHPGLVLGDPTAATGDRPFEPPAVPPDGAPWLAVVGPEGGLEPDEIAQLGVVCRLGVGRHVLRAETAAVAVATALALSRRIGHSE